MSGPPGSVWIEGDKLHWIDADQYDRSVKGSLVTQNPGGDPGSTWIEGGYIHYIDSDGEERKIS